MKELYRFRQFLAEGVIKENTLEYLIDKYGQKMIDFTIKVDQLTGDEVNDIEYLEDRIKTHLEEPAIRQKYLAEGKLLKEDESLDSKLDNLEDVYDPEPQISTAVFNEEGFYLTPSDIDAIKDTAQVEYSEYQNQEKMIGPEADSIIKKFKKEVTPEIWKDWVEYNEGDDRIAHILNLFNEIYAEGKILK